MIFPIISWVAIFFVIWWTALFVVLPIGVRTQGEEGHVVPGTDPGAPARLSVVRILLTTTLVSAAIFLLVMWVVTQQRFTLDDIPFLPRFERL